MNWTTTRWTMILTRQNRRHNEKEKETVRSDRLLFRWQEDENIKKGEEMMFEFTYSIKFRKGDSIVTMTVRAINEHQVYEKLGITKAEVIELKMIDGI